MDKEILDTRLIPLAEVKRILEEREKMGELNYTQRITLEHAQKFSKISPDRAIALIGLLVKEFGIEEYLAIQIVNVMPKYLEEIQVFFSAQRVNAPPKTNDELILILKTLMEFVFSGIMQEAIGIEEKKIIKLLLEKPRSVDEATKILGLRGEGKETKGKEAFGWYLRLSLASSLIVDHFLLPAQAAELIQKLPTTLKEVQMIVGELSDKQTEAITNQLTTTRRMISLATEYQVPLSISRVAAETPPSTPEDLKKQLGAFGASMSAEQLKEMFEKIFAL